MRLFQILVASGITAFSGGCFQENDGNYSHLDGTWQATWTLTDTSLLHLYSPHQLNMSGKMIFKNRNRVILRAHGYEGCAIASDTVENQLFYKYLDNTLLLINDNKEEIFAYPLKEITPGVIHLEMNDNIHLKLTK